MNFTRCPKKGNPLDQKRQKQFLWSSIMSIKSWEESGLLDLFRQQRTTFRVDLESKGNLHFFWKKMLILSQDGYFFSPKSLSAKDFGRAFWCVLSHSNQVLDPSILSHFDDWTWPRLEWDSNWKMHGSNATNGLSWLETLKKHGIAGSKLTHSLQRPLCVVFLVEFLLTQNVKPPAISWLSHLWKFWWCFVPAL